MTGGGGDIWNATDEFNYASQPASGDQTLIARVTSETDVNSWSKAGVMFRDSSAPGSMFVDLVATPGNGVSIQWRSATGGQCAMATLSGVAAPTTSAPVWLELVKNGDVYTGYCSPDGNTWYEVGSTTVNFSSVNYLAGLAVTSHNGGLACTATFDNVSLAPSLPVGWTVAGIGSPSPAGGGSFANGTYTVVGGGGDIWNTSDEFDYASQSTSGDQTLVARVTSETDADSWSKAGVMFRDSAAADSMFVDILATPGNGVSMQWRNATGTQCALSTLGSVAAPSASNPVWLKLVNSGSTYTGYYSPDGITWLEVGSTSVTFSNSNYLAGLAVTSHSGGVNCTATFDNVSLTASVSDNLALSAPVTVSSTDSAGDVGANAVDGNPSTNWTSGAGVAQWIEVDLGSTCSINEVQLNWGAAYASAYQIQVSNDGVHWTTLYSTTTGQGGIEDLTGLGGSGRDVQLSITAGSSSYSLNEFAVYPLTLTWAGGSGPWGPESADWVGPSGQLQTWQDGAAAVFSVPPSDGSASNVVSIFGQVSPSSITFLSGDYVLQAGADPAGDQIVLPASGAVIDVARPPQSIRST